MTPLKQNLSWNERDGNQIIDERTIISQPNLCKTASYSYDMFLKKGGYASQVFETIVFLTQFAIFKKFSKRRKLK